MIHCFGNQTQQRENKAKPVTNNLLFSAYDLVWNILTILGSLDDPASI